ncbi:MULTISPECIES: recombinase family protein [unclassified Lysobacter]|uniref:recombinase family protein n=1 Tax=unclassified Lysobacter TaxID=2635362 RepID=UPI001BE5A2A2|nr:MULTISPECIES: recombinase family protein [unclassified Lysobacter]MBT2748265.1 recombinase family protein [Lysobacter sp. ISL-42]MBT2749968.1 recombinase family protein [Lysobacter sp. ISL-50]MBT2781296.1 recombinase family protein [Lysobacter sp. ISL-52]
MTAAIPPDRHARNLKVPARPGQSNPAREPNMLEMENMRFAVYCYIPNKEVEELVFQRKLAEKAMAQLGASQPATLFIDAERHLDPWVRPELQRLLHAVKQDHFDCVVINEWAELATSVAEARRLMQNFDPENVVVVNAHVAAAMLVEANQ